HDGDAETRRFLVRQATAPRCKRPQRRANRSDIVRPFGARCAPFEVCGAGNLVADRQLAIVERLEPPPRRRAAEGLHAVLLSPSSWRSDFRARVRRDLTVPTATRREKAISS